MNRIELLNIVINKQKEIIKSLENSMNQYKKASDIDEDNTINPEDFSHQTEAKEMQLRLEQKIKEEAFKLELIEKNSKPSDHLKIIETNDIIILLGVSLPSFTEQNKQIIGISKDAPIYNSLKKLEKNNTFEFNKTITVVQNIY